jgi:hypothetical protein
MTDWRPMDELPDAAKDGRQVLLWNAKHGEAQIGSWLGSGDWWAATAQTGGEATDPDEFSHFAMIEKPT